MGEQTEAILNGECCQLCGEFFEEPTGYPTTCDACQPGADNE
jgi:hypothetical protein